MFNKSKLIAITIFLSYFTNSFTILDTLKPGWNLFKSASFFHVSLLYNKLMYGDSFNFNKIAGDNDFSSEAFLKTEYRCNKINSEILSK